MSNMNEPPGGWGGASEWQPPSDAGRQQPPPGQPYGQQPYSGGQQQPPPGQPYGQQQYGQGQYGQGQYGQGQYGQPYGQGPAPEAIRTYLIPAILVTLFCCLPTGIAAIIFAAQVSSKKNAGDYAGALRASKQARLWTIISVVVGIVLIVFILVSGSAGNTGSHG